jgi:hypothetical protein
MALELMQKIFHYLIEGFEMLCALVADFLTGKFPALNFATLALTDSCILGAIILSA